MCVLYLSTYEHVFIYINYAYIKFFLLNFRDRGRERENIIFSITHIKAQIINKFNSIKFIINKMCARDGLGQIESILR